MSVLEPKRVGGWDQFAENKTIAEQSSAPTGYRNFGADGLISSDHRRQATSLNEDHRSEIYRQSLLAAPCSFVGAQSVGRSLVGLINLKNHQPIAEQSSAPTGDRHFGPEGLISTDHRRQAKSLNEDLRSEIYRQSLLAAPCSFVGAQSVGRSLVGLISL